MGVVLWLPNIELIAAIIGNDALAIGTRFSLVLETYQLIFRFFGAVQLALVILFMMLTVVNTALFFHILHAQHTNRVTRARSNPALLAAVGSAGISVLGLMLLVPVVTAEGLVFGFNLHGPGVLITLIGHTGAIWAAHNLALLARSFET
jgi:hypothetical protein